MVIAVSEFGSLTPAETWCRQKVANFWTVTRKTCMQPSAGHGLAINAIRLVAGASLLWAGLSKIRHPVDFLTIVSQYGLLNSKEEMLVLIQA